MLVVKSRQTSWSSWGEWDLAAHNWPLLDPAAKSAKGRERTTYAHYPLIILRFSGKYPPWVFSRLSAEGYPSTILFALNNNLDRPALLGHKYYAPKERVLENKGGYFKEKGVEMLYVILIWVVKVLVFIFHHKPCSVLLANTHHSIQNII